MRFNNLCAHIVSILLTVVVFTAVARDGVCQSPSFSAVTIDADVAIGYGLAIGRVDKDDAPDIILADKTEIVWYRNPGQRNQEWQRHVFARNLTQRDNVCVTARDLTGDGLVEVAVGAQWNPGETDDPQKSGAVFYLQRPKNVRQLWQSIPLSPHDPTVHRMHWVRWKGQDALLVLPLHGVGNRSGKGKPVALNIYQVDIDDEGKLVDFSFQRQTTKMHMTHNFDVITGGKRRSDAGEAVAVAGREGVRWITPGTQRWLVHTPPSRGAGEIRTATVTEQYSEWVTIEPMHGNEVVFYQLDAGNVAHRTVLDDGFKQGHALAAADLLHLGRDQIVAGWRDPNAENKVGIRLYVPDDTAQHWQTFTIDDNQMACEDLKVADLDSDGSPDIIAAGRATNNLKVYWNDHAPTSSR